MTTQGASEPITAEYKMEVYRACLPIGSVHTEVLDDDGDLNGECLSFIENEDWAAYKNLRLKKSLTFFNIKAGSLSLGGEVEIRLDSYNGEIIGKCNITYTGGWEKWKSFGCCVKEIEGDHAVFLVFKGMEGRLFNIKSFSFSFKKQYLQL